VPPRFSIPSLLSDTPLSWSPTGASRCAVPVGSQTGGPTGHHNKRLDLTDANRYGAGPGASAIDRVRSSVARVVQPTPGRTRTSLLRHSGTAGQTSKAVSHPRQFPLGVPSDSTVVDPSTNRNTGPGPSFHSNSKKPHKVDRISNDLLRLIPKLLGSLPTQLRAA